MFGNKIADTVFPVYVLVLILNLLSVSDIYAQRSKTAKIQYRAETVEVDKKIGRGAQRLLDNVEFIHGGAKMYCDSAYFYSKKNSLDAYNNIFINQGDTLFLYGDFLHYDGNTKKAIVTGNVRLINEETTLTTDQLDYEMNNGVAYYTDYGKTINEDNVIESIKGYYYTRLKEIELNDSVVITNPEYQLLSDTVTFDTETEVATFQGPTDIIGDSSHIYGEKGWYDTENDIAEIQNNAWAENKQQTIYGQYIYYDKRTGDGIARDGVKIIEKDQSVMLTGNQAKYNDITEYAFLTDSAQFIQFTEEGDSLHLHADSLLSYPDTSENKMIFAYYNVRFFRENVQGKCDSLVYTFSDSTARMYYEPVLWTGINQVSADMIEMITKNQQMERMNLYASSFICSQKDTSNYDQIKGKDMICYFKENQLYQIDVKGNGQTVYFPEEEGEIVGVNISECSNLRILLEDGQVSRINFYVKPIGAMYPLTMAPQNKLRLKGFFWQEELRPKSKYDIF